MKKIYLYILFLLILIIIILKSLLNINTLRFNDIYYNDLIVPYYYDKYIKLTYYDINYKSKKLIKKEVSLENKNNDLIIILFNELKNIKYDDNFKYAINPITKIKNYKVKNNILYLNLSKEFLDNSYLKIDEYKDLILYSIVNTYCNLKFIDKVFISIDDVDITECLNLKTKTNLFEKNNDLIN